MRFVIVTGMSGAGKSTAMKMMEDMGFFCIDNLPIPLLDKLVDFATNFDTQMKMWRSELMRGAVKIWIKCRICWKF